MATRIRATGKTVYGPRIVRDGLVLYLDAANTKSYPGSGTIWTDLSGSDNNGTLTNVPTFDISNGGNILFDGINDFVQGPSGVLFFTNRSFSVETWLRPNSSPPSSQTWFSAFGPVKGTNKDIHFRIYGTGLIRMGFWGDDLNTSTGLINFGSWQKLVCTYDFSNDASRVYVNNSQVGSNNSGPFIDTSATIKIGSWDNSEYFKGNIASVAIYNRALSASEVLQNYNAQKSRFNL